MTPTLPSQRVAAGAIPDLRPSLDSERTTLITGVFLSPPQLFGSLFFVLRLITAAFSRLP